MINAIFKLPKIQNSGKKKGKDKGSGFSRAKREEQLRDTEPT